LSTLKRLYQATEKLRSVEHPTGGTNVETPVSGKKDPVRLLVSLHPEPDAGEKKKIPFISMFPNRRIRR